ncbi:hypothetical protein E1A91_D02G081200v1 [Gossypium mustelinum]|uniref:Uncharacterized protein n=1 Tax=Gossypium mustelinum TaxID=34275 RepID=A0A5D2VSZ0_GOSMU|nr:hypothetical protein E1A91_D02G081200v1 [Gossypium mustelinum]
MDLWFSCLGWGLLLPFLSDLTKPHFFSIQHLQHSLLQDRVWGLLNFTFQVQEIDNQSKGFQIIGILSPIIVAFLGMLGNSLASSLLTFDSATSCFCVPDAATSAPNIVPFSVTFSSRLP